MLTNSKDLIGSTIHATDGDVGSVETLYFDDDRWTVRYFVVDTGNWLPGRKVLISPFSIRQANPAGRAVHTSLTREQVRNSPDVDTARPVSRQQEMTYADYYGYPYYWGGPGVWGAAAVPMWPAVPPADGARAMSEARTAQRARDERNSHLRDAGTVKGHHIQAADGEVGHVEEFLIDDQSWTIRYFVVDTSNWIGGRRVLIAPAWVSGIRWESSKVDVSMTREAIRNSPEYDERRDVQRGYEEHLHAHYAQPPYWTEHDARSGAGARAESDRDRLARLEQLDDLKVARGNVDVRGWKVVASDGLAVGRVEHLIVDRDAMNVRYLEAGVDAAHEAGGRRDILIPLEYAEIDTSAREVRLPIVSRQVAALPAFKGLPIDADFAAESWTHFAGRAGSVEPDDDLRAERREPATRMR